ncbi:MAG: LacI family DNA-binding transcriptional regulator [Armatimonadota bacterium]
MPKRGVMASSGFSRKTTNNIALLDGTSYVLRVLVRRLSAMLSKTEHNLVHLNGARNIPLEDPLEYAAESGFAGALIWPFKGFGDEEVIARLTGSLPVVFMDHKLGGGLGDLVTFDYQQAAFEATSHLIKNGARRIGITGMLDMLDVTHQRICGYMKAMFYHGLQPDVRDYVFIHTSGMSVPDTLLLERRLEDADRPDALLVLQDEFVAPTVESLLKAGIRLPQDMKLVTIGDEIDLTVDGYGLTAIAPDWDAFASYAVELLHDRMANPTRDYKTVRAPHRLIVRGLCGSPESDWTPNPDVVTGFHGDFPLPRSQYRFSTSWSVVRTDPDHSLQ